MQPTGIMQDSVSAIPRRIRMEIPNPALFLAGPSSPYNVPGHRTQARAILEIAVVIQDRVHRNLFIKDRPADTLVSSLEQLPAIYQTLLEESPIGNEEFYSRLCKTACKLEGRRSKWDYFYARRLTQQIQDLSSEATRILADTFITVVARQSRLDEGGSRTILRRTSQAEEAKAIAIGSTQ